MNAEVAGALSDPDALWVPAAEPSTFPQAQNPAIGQVITQDAGELLLALTVTPSGDLRDASADPTTPVCSAGQILVECDGGARRCSVPCDGTVGDDAGAGGDPSCELVSTLGETDESICLAGECVPGTVACLPLQCTVPCDGSPTPSDCSPIVPEEDPLTCGTPAVTLAAAAAASSLLPEPRTDFTAVYTRQLDRLFVLGGRDGAGAPLGDAWVVTGGRATPFPTVPLGDRVLAATYTYRDGMLWVLDEARAEPAHARGRRHGHAWGRRRARLLRIDARTGEAEVVADWRRRRLFDRHWLVSDLDGSLLVVASSRVLKRHAVVRVEAVTGHVTNVILRKGELLFAPAVDGYGYAFVTKSRKRGKKHRDAFDYRRLRALGGEVGALGALGALEEMM